MRAACQPAHLSTLQTCPSSKVRDSVCGRPPGCMHAPSLANRSASLLPFHCRRVLWQFPQSKRAR
eukprot:547393-Amphidinium_carterae.2